MRRLEDLMDGLWGPFEQSVAGRAVESWTVPVDITEDDDHIVIVASVPGVKSDDLEVGVQDGVLTIKGATAEEHESNEKDYVMRERRTGEFFRSVRLPNTVDEDKADSKLEGGILTITFPKEEAAQPKKIPVSVID